MTLNMEKLEPLLHMMVGELGAAANAALVLVGDKLGLYRALSDHGPLSAKALAEKTGTHERYVRGMALGPGCFKLHRIRRGVGHLLHDA